jgi:hypothetical protein
MMLIRYFSVRYKYMNELQNNSENVITTFLRVAMT